jgi:hypothetical protein
MKVKEIAGTAYQISGSSQTNHPPPATASAEHTASAGLRIAYGDNQASYNRHKNNIFRHTKKIKPLIFFLA